MIELGVRPFTARSLVLSVLLGLQPPELPARSLVALADLFGIAAGTMRTALSRMVAAGDLETADGIYRLGARQLERKAAQDIGRRPPASEWDGSWWIAAVTQDRRGLAARRTFRAHMANLRMGELRPDTWMRPANLAGLTGDVGLAVVRGPLGGIGAGELVRKLWPLEEFAATAIDLRRRLDIAEPELHVGRPEALASTIGLSAAVVRFLRAEPLLPAILTPSPWPPEDLRTRYRNFDQAFGRVLTATLGRD